MLTLPCRPEPRLQRAVSWLPPQMCRRAKRRAIAWVAALLLKAILLLKHQEFPGGVLCGHPGLLQDAEAWSPGHLRGSNSYSPTAVTSVFPLAVPTRHIPACRLGRRARVAKLRDPASSARSHCGAGGKPAHAGPPLLSSQTVTTACGAVTGGSPGAIVIGFLSRSLKMD